MESSSSCYRFLRQGCIILQHLCASFIAIPLIVLIFGSFYIVRQIVNTFLHYRHNGRFQLLHPVDSVGSFNTASSARFTVCMQVRSRNAPLSLEKLRQKVYDNPEFRFGLYKKLQYRLCTQFGFICWEDMSINSQFDIKEHINIFPGIGDKPLTESKLMKLLTNCANSKASNTADQKPDWEILLVPQVRMKREYSTQNDTVAALILHINHGYMDGNSAGEFLRSFVMDKDEITRLPTDYMIEEGNKPKPISRKLNHICRLLYYGPMYAYRAMFCNSESIYLSPKNPCTTEETVMLARSNYSISSATMNKIRLAYGISSRTVIVSAFLAALRIAAEQKMIKPPNSLKLVCTHAMIPSSPRQPENRFAAIVKCLPLLELSPRFLTEIESLTKINTENEHEVDAAYWLILLLGLQPAKLLRLGREHVCSFTLGVTGGSGTKTLFKFQGGLVETFTAFPPQIDGIEYTCTFHNYGGKFSFFFCMKPTDVIKNNAELDDFIEVFDGCLQSLEGKANNLLDAKHAQAIENESNSHKI